MNINVKELAKQAGLNFDGYGVPIWGSLGSKDAFLEKFANLLIKECANVAFKSDPTMAIGQWGADSAILDHFGVAKR